MPFQWNSVTATQVRACCLTCKTQKCHPSFILVAESEVDTTKTNQVEKEMNQSEADWSPPHPEACLLHPVYLQGAQKAWTHLACAVTLTHHTGPHKRRAASTLNVPSVRGNPLLQSTFVPVAVRNQGVLPPKGFIRSTTHLWSESKRKKDLSVKLGAT